MIEDDGNNMIVKSRIAYPIDKLFKDIALSILINHVGKCQTP